MGILRHRGLARIHSGKGVAPRARRDLERGIAAGRFTVGDPVLALSALGGVLLSLVELRFSRPDLHGEEAAASLAEMALRMLGVPDAEAREIARCPLPSGVAD